MCRSPVMRVVELSPQWRGMQHFLVKALELDRLQRNTARMILSWPGKMIRWSNRSLSYEVGSSWPVFNHEGKKLSGISCNVTMCSTFGSTNRAPTKPSASPLCNLQVDTFPCKAMSLAVNEKYTRQARGGGVTGGKNKRYLCSLPVLEPLTYSLAPAVNPNSPASFFCQLPTAPGTQNGGWRSVQNLTFLVEPPLLCSHSLGGGEVEGK